MYIKHWYMFDKRTTEKIKSGRLDRDVVAIDPTGRFEERIADKEKFMVGDAVFECVGGLDLPARFDNHTTLLSNHFLKPEPVMLGE